jgi:hypothetical protein
MLCKELWERVPQASDVWHKTEPQSQMRASSKTRPTTTTSSFWVGGRVFSYAPSKANPNPQKPSERKMNDRMGGMFVEEVSRRQATQVNCGNIQVRNGQLVVCEKGMVPGFSAQDGSYCYDPNQPDGRSTPFLQERVSKNPAITDVAYCLSPGNSPASGALWAWNATLGQGVCDPTADTFKPSFTNDRFVCAASPLPQFANQN